MSGRDTADTVSTDWSPPTRSSGNGKKPPARSRPSELVDAAAGGQEAPAGGDDPQAPDLAPGRADLTWLPGLLRPVPGGRGRRRSTRWPTCPGPRICRSRRPAVEYSDGTPMAKIGTENRTIVPLSQVPDSMRWARALDRGPQLLLRARLLDHRLAAGGADRPHRRRHPGRLGHHPAVREERLPLLASRRSAARSKSWRSR